MPTVYTDLIVCPRCALLQEADVTYEPADPWPTYVKECDRCGYIILESEWDSVRETLYPQGAYPHGTLSFD